MKIIKPNEQEEKKINQGIHDDPEAQEWTDDMFSRAVRGAQKAPTKKQLTVRFDPDVVEWFQNQGRGYQSRMNQALREHMEENRML